MTSPRIVLASVLGPLAGLAALLLPAPAGAQLSTPTVPTVPVVTGPVLTVPTTLSTVTVPTLPDTAGGTAGTSGGRETAAGGGGTNGAGGGIAARGLDGSVAAGAERPGTNETAAKDSAVLSALAVVMLVLIVAGTALMGSRKSPR
ncbi:MAG TPA: hypothetical protein VMZ73_03175 [Acidimicrobiales bacterium]|nr:hypothetical protein [Acidimicrobiales bacterium]